MKKNIILFLTYITTYTNNNEKLREFVIQQISQTINPNSSPIQLKFEKTFPIYPLKKELDNSTNNLNEETIKEFCMLYAASIYQIANVRDIKPEDYNLLINSDLIKVIAKYHENIKEFEIKHLKTFFTPFHIYYKIIDIFHQIIAKSTKFINIFATLLDSKVRGNNNEETLSNISNCIKKQQFFLNLNVISALAECVNYTNPTIPHDLIMSIPIDILSISSEEIANYIIMNLNTFALFESDDLYKRKLSKELWEIQNTYEYSPMKRLTDYLHNDPKYKKETLNQNNIEQIIRELIKNKNLKDINSIKFEKRLELFNFDYAYMQEKETNITTLLTLENYESNIPLSCDNLQNFLFYSIRSLLIRFYNSLYNGLNLKNEDYLKIKRLEQKYLDEDFNIVFPSFGILLIPIYISKWIEKKIHDNEKKNIVPYYKNPKILNMITLQHFLYKIINKIHDEIIQTNIRPHYKQNLCIEFCNYILKNYSLYLTGNKKNIENLFYLIKTTPKDIEVLHNCINNCESIKNNLTKNINDKKSSLLINEFTKQFFSHISFYILTFTEYDPVNQNNKGNKLVEDIFTWSINILKTFNSNPKELNNKIKNYINQLKIGENEISALRLLKETILAPYINIYNIPITQP